MQVKCVTRRCRKQGVPRERNGNRNINGNEERNVSSNVDAEREKYSEQVGESIAGKYERCVNKRV